MRLSGINAETDTEFETSQTGLVSLWQINSTVAKKASQTFKIWHMCRSLKMQTGPIPVIVRFGWRLSVYFLQRSNSYLLNWAISNSYIQRLPDRSSAVNLKMRRLVGNIDPIPMARRPILIKASSSPYSEGTVERGLARI